MRGDVLHYDETQGFGFIAGADGNRYTFAREDLRGSATAPAKGMQIEFQPNGGQARDVFPVQAQIAAAATPSAPSAPPPPRGSASQFGRRAGEQADQQPDLAGAAAQAGPTGLWSYFLRGITTNYVNFRGRARRKEYWGYYLFWTMAFVAALLAGFAIDGAMGNLDGGAEEPVALFAIPGLFFLATFLPGLAITIRRIHDLGLSGWFYLLILLPYVGGLIIFVFTLIPSQKHENKWGAVPAGVRVPQPYIAAA